jgi:MFS family permease
MNSGALRSGLPLLKRGNFARYAVGRLCTNVGWEMLVVAVGWQVYAITSDPLALGLVGLWEFLPFVSLILLGGYAADHANRRTILIIAAGVECVCVLSLLGLTLSDVSRPWPIYVAVAVFGSTRAFWAPAMQAYLVNLVPREDFTAAAALDSLLRQVAVVGGPALGGFLYLLGAHVVYEVCAVLFALTVLLTFGIHGAPVRANVDSSVDARGVHVPGRGHQLLEGLRYLRRNHLVLGVISLDLFAVLFGGAAAMLPIFARDILATGPVGLGLLRTAPAFGAALVGIVIALRPLREHAGLWMFGGVVTFGLATIVFGLSTSFLLSLVALTVAGAGDMISVYIRTVLVQLHTPDSIRGRVSAVNSMFIGASNELGAFESGVMARWLGIVPSVVAGGCASLVVVAAWLLLFPQLRRLPPLR